MSAIVVAVPPRARIIVHPGRPRPVRMQSAGAPQARHFRLLLEPGLSLFDGLVQPLLAAGITSASTTLLGGALGTLFYCVAPPDPAGDAVIAYGPPIAAGRSFLVFGNATLGKARDGAPLVHCHAAIRDADGALRGGHVLTERTVVAAPITVLVTAFAGFELRLVHDPETNIALLQPFAETVDG